MEIEFIYEVHDFSGKKIEYIEAKSMIEAAKKFLKRNDVKKMSHNDLCICKWKCKVYKYDKADLRVPYNEGYYC